MNDMVLTRWVVRVFLRWRWRRKRHRKQRNPQRRVLKLRIDPPCNLHSQSARTSLKQPITCSRGFRYTNQVEYTNDAWPFKGWMQSDLLAGRQVTVMSHVPWRPHSADMLHYHQRNFCLGLNTSISFKCYLPMPAPPNVHSKDHEAFEYKTLLLNWCLIRRNSAVQILLVFETTQNLPITSRKSLPQTASQKESFRERTSNPMKCGLLVQNSVSNCQTSELKDSNFEHRVMFLLSLRLNLK